MIPTGTASLLDIQNEFGGATPISLGEYYVNGGGGYVISGQYTTIQGNPPFSGPISIADFRGVSKITNFVFNDVVTTNQTGLGYVLRTRAISAGWNTTVPIIATVTINPGVTVTADTGYSGAFNTLNIAGWPAGSSLTLINNGTIAGGGGAGGVGGAVNGASLTNGGNGANGGVGLYINALPTNVYNNGTIGGGGGGGGGGAARYFLDTAPKVPETYGASGGGGAGGRANGAAAANGAATGNTYNYGVSPAATSGTLSAPGAGSGSSNVGPFGPDGGPSGAGGNLGQPGFPGGLGGGETTSNSLPGAGGAAGNAVTGGSFITWYAFGSRLGTIDNPGINMVPGGPTNGQSFQSWYGTLSPTNAIANFIFNTDGTTSVSGTSFQNGSNTPNWYSPTSGGIGASYWIRATLVSQGGGTYTGTLSTWLQLNSARSWSVTRSTTGTATRNLTIEIATDAAGVTIVATHTLTLTADEEI